jgi:hypothetical protein
MTGTVSGPAGCSAARDLLPLHFYGLVEGEERRALERHLSECGPCAAAWEETRLVLGSVDASAAFPRESEVDWPRFARETALRARAAEGFSESPRRAVKRAGLRPALAWGSLAAFCAAVVLFAGLRALRPGAPGAGDAAPPAGDPGPAPHGAPDVSPESTRFLQQGLARRGAARYLRDSRALLVDLVHASVRCRRTDGSLDVALETERAQDLLRRKNLYLDALAGPRDQRLADLVRQLEALLLQVSSLDDCAAARQIHDLREAIERRQILLRIDLVAGEAEGRGAHA